MVSQLPLDWQLYFLENNLGKFVDLFSQGGYLNNCLDTLINQAA